MYSLPQKRIFKSDKKSSFTQISNEIINKTELSMKAKGILIYCLSKPDNWKINVDDIVNHCKEGDKAIRSGIKELIDQGYMRRYPIREGNKIKEWVLETYEIPQTIASTVDADFVHVQKDDKPNGQVQNRHFTNTVLSNKEFKNKEINNTPVLSTQEILLDSLPKGIKDMLLSVKRNKQISNFDIKFLESFKEAYNKTKHLNINPIHLKIILIDTLYYLENKSADDLTGFIISKIRKLHAQQLKRMRG